MNLPISVLRPRAPRIFSAIRALHTASILTQTRSHTRASSFPEWRTPFGRASENMATPSTIHLTSEDTGIVPFRPQTAETAAKTSEILQENHEKYHIYFNQSGFHNHIVHHLLTLYGLGAPASAIEKHYRDNASYQRPMVPVKESDVQDMSNPDHFNEFLGREKYYHSFLVFWQTEMEKKGWQSVLNEYVFAGDARADDLLVRLYSGFLHPLIHLGFGIEFHQPAIIAEALAQACTHDKWIGDYLLKAEKEGATVESSKTLPQLIDEIRGDEKLSTAAEWEDANKIRDGILKRAPDEMVKYAKQWTVPEGELEKKTAEMIINAVYFTALAQHPPKQVKFDFYYMHCVNSSIFFPIFNAQPWLADASKRRLLKLKGYLDLAMYASRRSPALLPAEAADYVPARQGSDAEWKGLFQRLFALADDGHAVKLGRAVANAELVARKYEGEEWARIQAATWEKIGNMVVDSVEDSGDNWARSVGFAEAWKVFEDRPRTRS